MLKNVRVKVRFAWFNLTCKDPELGRDEEHLEDLEAELPRKLPETAIYYVKTIWLKTHLVA